MSLFVVLSVIALSFWSEHSAFFISPKHLGTNIVSYSTKEEIPQADKLQKIEAIKPHSNYLKDPLEEEMKNEEIFVNHGNNFFKLF